jgi:hypothetical protein
MPCRVDAVGVPARRVRGHGDDLPPLVERPLRRTEVDADHPVDLERAAKQGTSVPMTLQFSLLPPTWSRAIRSATVVGPARRARWDTDPPINRPADACDHADARTSRERLATCIGRHRSSRLASLRPDDEQPGPSTPRRSCRPTGPTVDHRVRSQTPLGFSLPTGQERERESRLTRRSSSSLGVLCEHTREDPPPDAPRAKRSDFWGETAKPPRIAPWGLLLTDPRPLLATREKWLPRHDSNMRPGD